MQDFLARVIRNSFFLKGCLLKTPCSCYTPKTMEITYEEFEKIDLRSGTVIKAEPFPKARNPSYKLWVDFGSLIGVKQTSAQITHNYSPESLIGMQVVGCVNLGQRNIAGFISEFLLLGFADEHGCIVLIEPHSKIPNGQKLY